MEVGHGGADEKVAVWMKIKPSLQRTDRYDNPVLIYMIYSTGARRGGPHFPRSSSAHELPPSPSLHLVSVGAVSATASASPSLSARRPSVPPPTSQQTSVCRRRCCIFADLQGTEERNPREEENDNEYGGKDKKASYIRQERSVLKPPKDSIE